MKIRTNLFVVSRTREEKYNIAAKNTTSVAGNLPPYTLEMTQRWEILVLANLFCYWGNRSYGLLHRLIVTVDSAGWWNINLLSGGEWRWRG